MAEIATQLYGNATELVNQFIASTKPLPYDLYASTDVSQLNVFEVSTLISLTRLLLSSVSIRVEREGRVSAV